MRKNKKEIKKLDTEEEELLSSYEKGEWKSVANIKKEKFFARKTAVKTLNNGR